jgi:3alpha(or 20beta)-hydroxysteroid dehydrogenase
MDLAEADYQKVYAINQLGTFPGMMAAATDDESGDALSMIPLSRLADSWEGSQLAIFLSSDESSFITGHEHVIDGGMTAA